MTKSRHIQKNTRKEPETQRRTRMKPNGRREMGRQRREGTCDENKGHVGRCCTFKSSTHEWESFLTVTPLGELDTLFNLAVSA